MKRFMQYGYCYFTLVLINSFSFLVGQYFKIDWNSSTFDVSAFLLIPLIFILYVLVLKEIFKIKYIYFKLPFALLILKTLFIIPNDNMGMNWEVIEGVSKFIFYPTSIISFMTSDISNSFIFYSYFILLVFFYETFVLWIYKF